MGGNVHSTEAKFAVFGKFADAFEDGIHEDLGVGGIGVEREVGGEGVCGDLESFVVGDLGVDIRVLAVGVLGGG